MSQVIPENRSSNDVDNNKEIVDTVLGLVGINLHTYLLQNYNNNCVRLSTVLDELPKFGLTINEKKVVYWILNVGITYLNELKRIYRKTAPQPFDNAIQSLIRKGFLRVVESSPELDRRRRFLEDDLKYASAGVKQKMKFYTFCPGAREFFAPLIDEFKQDFLSDAPMIEREAARYQLVVKQVENDKRLRVQRQREKYEELALQERLSREVDDLIIQCKDDATQFRPKSEVLLKEHPAQKAFLLGRFRRLWACASGTDRLSWDLIVEQTMRRAN